MAEQKQIVVWVADSPVPAEARFHRYYAWEHHAARLHRVAWGAQIELQKPPGTDRLPIDEPAVQLFSVRHNSLLNDHATLGGQGVIEGDVLVLLPDPDPRWREAVEAYRHQFPKSLSTDIATGSAPLTWPEIEAAQGESDEHARRKMQWIIGSAIAAVGAVAAVVALFL